MQCGELGLSMATKFHNRGRKNNPLQGNAVIAVPRLGAGGGWFQTPAAGGSRRPRRKNKAPDRRLMGCDLRDTGLRNTGLEPPEPVSRRDDRSRRRANVVDVSYWARICCAPVPMMRFLDLKHGPSRPKKTYLVFSPKIVIRPDPRLTLGAKVIKKTLLA